MNIGIYKITSPSGKIYIGQTWNFKRRLYEYKTSCKKQVQIFNSISKYGFENHKFELVHELPEDTNQEILDQYEIFYYNHYKELKFRMLNSREPGKGGKLTKETKKKLSIAHIGMRHSEETKTKIKNSATGRKFSEETKIKISISQKKRLNLLKENII